MAKTETELATEVLEHMGVVGAGQSAEANDLDKVVRAYRSKYEELAAPGLEYVYWERASIPDAIFLMVRDIVTLEVQGAFGQPISAAEKEAEEIVVLRRIRRHKSVGASGLPTVAEYF